MKHYRLTGESKPFADGRVYQIQATKDFFNEAAGCVIEEGEIGGYISPEDVSLEDTSWVYPNGILAEGATLKGDSIIVDSAMLFDGAVASNGVCLLDSACVSGSDTLISDFAKVGGAAYVCGGTVRGAGTTVGGNALIGNAIVGDVTHRHLVRVTSGAILPGAVILHSSHVATYDLMGDNGVGYTVTLQRTAEGPVVNVGPWDGPLEDFTSEALADASFPVDTQGEFDALKDLFKLRAAGWGRDR